jgi:bacillithiol system protein YtxJ
VNDDSWIHVTDVADLDALAEQPLAVLYKHSPLCGLSDMAATQVRAFSRANPGVPIYYVDVIRSRPLSREVARRLNVRHESPQAFVLRAGAVTWDGSHRAVTADALERGIAGDTAPQREDAT